MPGLPSGRLASVARYGTEGSLRSDELVIVERDEQGNETRTLRSRSRGRGAELVLGWDKARVLAQAFRITPSMLSVADARIAFGRSVWMCRTSSSGQERRLHAAVLAHQERSGVGTAGKGAKEMLRLGSFRFGNGHSSSGLRGQSVRRS